MSLVLRKVDWTGKDTSAELSDIISLNITKGMEPKVNKCEITLVNPLNRIGDDGTAYHKYVNHNSGIIKFGEGDVVKVYAAHVQNTRDLDTSDTSDDLIMTCEIAEIQIKSDGKKSTIILKCVDKTYTMLNQLWAWNYNNTEDKTAPEIIQDVIHQISDDPPSDSPSFDVNGNEVTPGRYTIDARLMTGTYPCTAGDPPAYIQNNRPNSGGVFPSPVIMAKGFKPVYEWVKDLSQTEHTNSSTELANGTEKAKRPYIFYIDQNNRFHWFYPGTSKRTLLTTAIDDDSTTFSVTTGDGTNFDDSGIVQIGSELIEYSSISSNTFTIKTREYNNTIKANHSIGDDVTNSLNFIEGDNSTGHEIYSYNLSKKTFDIINHVIFNCGQDLYGSGTLNHYYNPNSETKELKTTYKPWKDVTKQMIKQELPTANGGNGNLVEDNSTPGPFTFNGNRYKESTGNYDTGSGITTAWGEVVTDDSEYNDSVRNYAAFNDNSAGITRAERLTRSRSSPRWKGRMVVKGRRYHPGDLINFTSSRAGIYRTDLRIKQSTHQISKVSWTTTLTLEEDEPEIGV